MPNIEGSQPTKLLTPITPIDDLFHSPPSDAWWPKVTAVGEAWSDMHEAVVAGPYNYLLQNPGKGVRAQAMQAFNAWMDVPTDPLKIIANSINMLHSASLLIDDVQDNSTLRQGIPVAHSIYGVAQTINSANYFYFCAMKELQKLESSEAMTHFADELLQLHRGQGMDLHWRDSLICPTEDEYLKMISNKTGGLFRLTIKLMQTQSSRPASPDDVCLADALGVIFQIRDDYQNICSQEYTKSKGYCEDLSEGKFSFPVIHSIQHDPTNSELLNILRQKPTESHIKQYAIQCMKKTGSVEYTRKVLRGLIAQGRQMVDMVSGSPETRKLMHAVLNKLAV
ncbi:hypothetical protein VE03_10545 [Pseudogymnoascus sp. 23342-1-I1]|nr:hypothetical protein VE03_10545 [Pseudogymnoascus sp. 23342-1-I1]